MKANVGDRIIIRGRHTGQPMRACRVVEVHGGEGPYLVRWEENEHETLYFPGSDATVEHAKRPAKRSAR